MRTIRAKDVLGDSAARAVYSHLRGADAFPPHRHDFPEVFWIEAGRGVHRVNGSEQEIAPGSLVWIRPADCHGFSSDSDGLRVHNVAFSSKWFAGFRRRHFEGDGAFWSGDAKLPEHRRLGGGQLERLATEFAELGREHGAARAAERFLLNVLHVSATGPSVAARQTAGGVPEPAWLEPALRAWAEPAAWAGGTRALARLAGRSEEHVARVVKSVTGRNPTDWLNEHRMKHAAHLLAATDRKVVDVALECGFASLGHFYAMFKRQHACSPASYRRSQPPRPL